MHATIFAVSVDSRTDVSQSTDVEIACATDVVDMLVICWSNERFESKVRPFFSHDQ